MSKLFSTDLIVCGCGAVSHTVQHWSCGCQIHRRTGAAHKPQFELQSKKSSSLALAMKAHAKTGLSCAAPWVIELRITQTLHDYDL